MSMRDFPTSKNVGMLLIWFFISNNKCDIDNCY